MANLTVTVVERPAIKTAGIKIRTDMAKAGVDCPKVWSDDFGPRMGAFPWDASRSGESYGLCIMIDSDAFDYWAVAPIAAGAAVPDGMDTITIPGGPYAECRLASLAEMGEAFNLINSVWSAGQEKYAVNMQGMSVEVYTCEYMKNGSLTLHVPLIEK